MNDDRYEDTPCKHCCMEREDHDDDSEHEYEPESWIESIARLERERDKALRDLVEAQRAAWLLSMRVLQSNLALDEEERSARDAALAYPEVKS